MKAIMLMFDSLNRHMLPSYGCDWTHAPNFKRLAERTVAFDNSYVCSMPCMPARRDLLTGRPNFLHRSWGPIEPFDDSVPRLLSERRIYTHLASDHYHYWEAGGATYHTQYESWEFFRGQEGDPWMGQVADPPPVNAIGRNAAPGQMHRQDRVNRQFIRRADQHPQAQTMASGLDFIRRNAREDRWFLQIETFDPHEPFFAHRQYKDLYPQHYLNYKGPLHDWPAYDWVQETREQVEHLRYEYASLLSMCDARLGDLLDVMDELSLWDDTMLIVWTDHGFLLGEHDAWAKCWIPFYNEVAHTPFFVWDPRGGQRGERRAALVQPAIDLGPTLLDFFELSPAPDMLGRALRDTIAADQPVRQAALFGQHGHHVNVTDGRCVYMRAPARPENAPLFEYTLMPTHMRAPFSVAELRGKIDLAEPFSFTKGCRVMRIPAQARPKSLELGTLLFDLQADPGQERPIQDPAVEQKMIDHLIRLMRECDAPEEQFERLGLAGVAALKREA